jgi:hypothetical protein
MNINCFATYAGAVNSTPIVSAYGCTLGGNQQHNSSTKTTLPQTSSETVTHLSTPRVFLTKITSASAQSSSTHFQNNVESRTLIDETAITSTRNPGRQISSQIQWSTVLVNSDSSSPRAATMQTGSPVPSGPKSDTPPGDVPVLDTMQTDRLQITVNPPTHASLIEETETAYHASQSSFTTSKMTSISFYEAQITSTQLPETREGVSTAASSHSSSLSAVTQYTRTTEAESKPRPFSETASAERSWGNQCKPIQETTSNFNVTAHTSMSAESNLTISHSTAAQSNAQVTNADGRRSTRTTLAQGQTSADPSSVQAGAPSSKATDSSPISTDSTSSPAASKKEAVLMSTTTTAKSPTFHETRTTDISAISQTTGYTSMAQDPHNTDSLTSRSIRMTGSTGTSYQSDLLPTLFSRYISAVESSGVANTGPSTPPTSAANVVTLQLASQPTTTTLGADPIHDTVRIKTSQITASSPTYAAMVALTETVNGGSEASLTVSQMTSISSDATPITGKPSVRTPETPYMTISSLSSSPSLIQPTQAVESKSETRPYHETIFLHHITTSQRETTRFTSMDTVMNVANPTVAGAGGSSATRPTITGN